VCWYADVNYVERSLIYAEKVDDVAIFGQGVIDGQGGAEPFKLPGDREHFKQRPFIIRMEVNYPEHKMFGWLPAFGFWCRHVRGLRLHDVQLGTAKADARPGLVCEDVQGLDVRGWQAASAPAGREEILWRDVSAAWLHGGRSAEGAAVHLRVAGAKSGPIKINDVWGREGAKLVVVDPEVPPGTVVQQE